jgi:hypothetical protein
MLMLTIRVTGSGIVTVAPVESTKVTFVGDSGVGLGVIVGVDIGVVVGAMVGKGVRLSVGAEVGA